MFAGALFLLEGSCSLGLLDDGLWLGVARPQSSRDALARTSVFGTMHTVSLSVGSPLLVVTPEGERPDAVVRLIDPTASPLGVQMVETQRNGACVVYRGRGFALRPAEIA